jgi:uncharacterized protein
MHETFLGRGWSFPPAFTGGGREVAMISDEEDIRQSLVIILSTQAGERTMFADFGSDLYNSLFEEVDKGLITRLTDTIADAILHYEPRITLDQLDVHQSDSEAGVLLVSLHYTIKAVNSRYNMVYPFYVKESINP